MNEASGARLIADCEFGHQQAVGQCRRSFVPGRVYGLVGANGAGKSTLLRTLAGELEPVSGSVILCDESRPDNESEVDVAHRNAAGRLVNIAEPVFLPDLSVGEHMTLMSKHSGRDFDSAVSTWQLGSLISAAPSQLSSGQRQRVFLATQLQVDKERVQVVLLDEPERHLDTAWQQFVARRLRALASDGVIVIVAAHSPEIVAACDELMELGA